MADKDIEVSVNLTGDDLSNASFVEYVVSVAERYGIQHNRVVFEILEEIESITADQTKLTIRELKSMGFRIAIDDFGSDYSNFDRMLDLNPDYLKIDMKYVR